MKAMLGTLFGVNWTTNLPALGFTLCASTELLGFLPSSLHQYALAFCALMISIGFFAAKSANVSNAAKPGEAQVVP